MEDEFERYMRVPMTGEAPLTWWKVHADAYPRLARMARDFLGCTGSEAPSERAFASARRLISWERGRLSDTTIQVCKCVKSWLELQ